MPEDLKIITYNVATYINTIYIFIFVSVNFRGFHGHLVIHENNIFVNPQKLLLGKSTKISAV